MYGHALNLFNQCAFSGCTRPATIMIDDGRIVCAACANEHKDQI